MRAMIIFTALLLNQFVYAQTNTSTDAAPAVQPAAKQVKPAKKKAPKAKPAPVVEEPVAPVATPEPAVEPIPAEAPVPAVAEETGTPEIPTAFREGIFVSPSLTYFSRKLDETNSLTPVSAEASTLQLDVKSGYIFDFGLFAGAQLVYSSGKATVTGVNTDITTYFGGPSVGYSCKTTGIFITATYHLFGKADWDTLGGEYEKMTGLQVDLGYPMNLTESIKLGPQLSWKRIKHSDNTLLAADYTSKEVVPYLGLWFYF